MKAMGWYFVNPGFILVGTAIAMTVIFVIASFLKLGGVSEEVIDTYLIGAMCVFGLIFLLPPWTAIGWVVSSPGPSSVWWRWVCEGKTLIFLGITLACAVALIIPIVWSAKNILAVLR